MPRIIRLLFCCIAGLACLVVSAEASPAQCILHPAQNPYYLFIEREGKLLIQMTVLVTHKDKKVTSKEVDTKVDFEGQKNNESNTQYALRIGLASLVQMNASADQQCKEHGCIHNP